MPRAPWSLIGAKRIRGGYSNGAYLKKIKIAVEFLRGETAGQTSVHMRYEVEGPSRSTKDALGAIAGYFERPAAVASGKQAPRPAVAPACPYDKPALAAR